MHQHMELLNARVELWGGVHCFDYPSAVVIGMRGTRPKSMLLR